MMIDPPYRAIDPSLQVLPAPGLHSLVYEKDFPDIDAFSEEVCKELNARPLHPPPLLLAAAAMTWCHFRQWAVPTG